MLNDERDPFYDRNVECCVFLHPQKIVIIPFIFICILSCWAKKMSKKCNTGSIRSRAKETNRWTWGVGEKRNKTNEWSGREGRVEERE